MVNFLNPVKSKIGLISPFPELRTRNTSLMYGLVKPVRCICAMHVHIYVSYYTFSIYSNVSVTIINTICDA